MYTHKALKWIVWYPTANTYYYYHYYGREADVLTWKDPRKQVQFVSSQENSMENIGGMGGHALGSEIYELHIFAVKLLGLKHYSLYM